LVKNVLPSLFGAIVLAIGAGPSAQAALLVDWGGNYVGANQAYSNPNASPATAYGGFSGGNPLQLSPALSASYSGTSALFYGQVALNSGSGTFATSNTGIINNGNGDRIEFKLDNNNFSALFLWRQADFLNSYNSGSINLATGSTIALNTTTNANPGGTGGRAVIRVGTTYYISEVISPASGTTGLISEDLTALDWFNYNPASALNTIGSSASLASGGVISNVTEVGFYYNVAGNPNAIRINSVEFDYVAVPEPSAAALLAAGIGFTVIRRRRLSKA
jgi:hypothetical protein